MRGHSTGILGLIRQMSGQRKVLALTVLAGIVAQGGTLASLTLAAWLTGVAICGAPASDLLPLIAGLAGQVLFTAAARWWQSWISHFLAFTLIEKLQMRIFDGLERAAPATVLGQRTGELAAIATHDAELMERFYAHTLADYVGAMLVPAAALAGLYAVAPPLAWVLAPFLLLVATVPVWLARYAARQGKQVMRELGQLNADTLEFIAGQRELAVFGQAEAFVQRLLQRTRTLGKAQQHYGVRSGLEQAAIDLLSAAALLAMIFCILSLLAKGELQPMLLPLIVVLASGALLPITEVTQTASQWGELRAGAARILAIMQQRARVLDQGISVAPSNTRLRVEQVHFAYHHRSRPVLQGVSFQVESGEIVALVGASGVGKSTLGHLLLRFWDPDSGAIYIGERDIRTLPLATLRQLITWVPQEVSLFAGSVRENIRLGNPQASDQQVAHAARLAQAESFIAALPLGYDTLCGERGTRLSGGQRQRIAIARALLTNAPIMIFDEASSSLDNENEQAVHQALDSLRHQRTIVLIAHRPATLQRADRVLVLEDGQIKTHPHHTTQHPS